MASLAPGNSEHPADDEGDEGRAYARDQQPCQARQDRLDLVEAVKGLAELFGDEEEVFVCAIGIPAIKRRVSELLASRGARFTRLIHRSAVVGDNVELGEGVVLCPYAVVSANNRLGRGVAINLHSSVDHDACVDDWTQVNCHCDLTGGVQVGKEVFFGSSVAIIPGVRIGDGAYLGAGSVVLRDVPAGAKVFGVPARQRE
jgi:sugar O-acyltransferase (sialic acid O-acetyltransferase NeuD family)